jgi:hypothetical protein
MANNELNILTSDNNTVSVIAEDRVITIVNDGDITNVTIPQSETSTVQIASFGPRGPKGDVGNVDVTTLATTGSNTFNGNQLISGSSDFILAIHAANDNPWAFGIYNDSYTPTQSVLAGWVGNTGESYIGTEVNKPLNIYTNANYYDATLIISSSGIIIDNRLIVNNGITGSLFGSASYSETASYALNAGAGAGFPYSGSAVITGSLVVVEGGITASIYGYVPNEATTSFIVNSQTSSFVINSQTSSFVTNSQTGSFITNNQTSSFVTNSQTSSFIVNSQTSSFVTNDKTGSFIVNSQTSSMSVATASYYAETDPIYTAEKSKYLTTGSSNQTQTISGSLVINQNLTILGSQSVQYVTSSQLNISTNIITVNTSTPAIRFGGLAVYDSGSTGLTGSILWDSQRDNWIYTNPSGGLYDGAMFLVGPRSMGIGNEVGITTNYLSKGDGEHHMTSSQISDDGTKVTIPGNLVVNGTITGSFSGSVVGYVPNSTTGSFIINSQTSSFLLNTQTGSMLSPYTLNSQTSSFVLNSQTSSFVTNSQTSSFVTNSQTSSFVQNSQTSSFVLNSQTSSILSPYTLNSQTSSFVTNSQTGSFVVNNQTGSFATTGSNRFIGNQTITGSATITGSVILTGSFTQNASTASFAGRVGIGTTTPVSSLHVSGTTTIAGPWNSNFTNGVHLGFTSNTGSIYSLQNGSAWRRLEIEGNHLILFRAVHRREL